MTRKEMDERGWSALDVLLVTGDAYVDHPAFGVSVIARILEKHGYRVGIAPQPRWDTIEDLLRMGSPELFVGITAGANDSMSALRTAHRKNRRFDRCTPGGRAGKRPPRAAIVYAQLARRAFGDIPIILGGIEPSTRRFVHYDFWQHDIRRSCLADAKADLLVYGMGERACLEIARRLSNGMNDLTNIPGTCRIVSNPPDHCTDEDKKSIVLPSLEDIKKDPRLLIDASKIIETCIRKRPFPHLYQEFEDRGIIAEPPPPHENGRALDAYYELPYTRNAHPLYNESVPALDTVRWSLTSHRGCFGGCSFCSVALHAGYRIGSRTTASLVREARTMVRMQNFRGAITDVGGPTANMYKMGCRSGAKGGKCNRVSCLHPSICADLNTSHSEWLKMLKAIRLVPGVKHVRVASGIRHDLILENPEALLPILLHYTGGRMRVAPEHVAGKVLRLMRKPDGDRFGEFVDLFMKTSRKCPRKVELAAYLMTSFPGSGTWERDLLARMLQTRQVNHYEVQCFTPTPGTTASAMYFARCDDRKKPLFIPSDDRSRKKSTLIESR